LPINEIILASLPLRSTINIHGIYRVSQKRTVGKLRGELPQAATFGGNFL